MSIQQVNYITLKFIYPAEKKKKDLLVEILRVLTLFTASAY